MDPVAAPTLAARRLPPLASTRSTTGYRGPLGVALPPPASSDIGLGALGPLNDPPCRRARQASASVAGCGRAGMQPPPSAFGPTSLSEAVSHRSTRGPARARRAETPRPTPSRSRAGRRDRATRRPTCTARSTTRGAAARARARRSARRTAAARPRPAPPERPERAAGAAPGAARSSTSSRPRAPACATRAPTSPRPAGNARRQLKARRFYGRPARRPAGLRRGGRPPADARPPPAPRGYGARSALRPHGPAARLPRGPHGAHVAPPPRALDTDAAVAAEYAHLDQKAAAALQALPALQSTQILLELRKRGAIRNPEATSCVRRRTPPRARCPIRRGRPSTPSIINSSSSSSTSTTRPNAVRPAAGRQRGVPQRSTRRPARRRATPPPRRAPRRAPRRHAGLRRRRGGLRGVRGRRPAASAHRQPRRNPAPNSRNVLGSTRLKKPLHQEPPRAAHAHRPRSRPIFCRVSRCAVPSPPRLAPRRACY